jgi:hypothetical protein
VRSLLERSRLEPRAAVHDWILFGRAGRDTVPWIEITSDVPQAPARIVYAEQVEFLGCDLMNPRLARGDTLTLRTYWTRRDSVDRLFLTLLWLLDEKENVALYHTRYLGYGIHTTERWPAGVPVRETYRLVIPSGLAAGRYRLVQEIAERTPEGARHALADDPRLGDPGSGLLLGVVELR